MLCELVSAWLLPNLLCVWFLFEKRHGTATRVRTLLALLSLAFLVVGLPSLRFKWDSRGSPSVPELPLLPQPPVGTLLVVLRSPVRCKVFVPALRVSAPS